MATSSLPCIAEGDRFECLAAALTHFRQNYPENTFRHEGTDPLSGERFEVDVPRWLYRGETGVWPETTSSMERIKSHQHRAFAGLPIEVHDDFANALEVISLKASGELERWLGLGQMQAAGLAQHYGLPSEFLDVTSSLEVATAFAVDDALSWIMPRKVSFAVIDMWQAVDRCIIADLAAMIKMARRPAIQHAYGFWHESYRDLKDSNCIADIGVRWHEILVHPEEMSQYVATPDLLDAHKDQAAGVLQLILDDLAKPQKWPDEVAKLLSSTVAAAPFVTRVIRWEGSKPAEVELVSAEEMGYSFDEVATREESRQLWSAAFPTVTKRHL